ncbi:MAG: DUF4838 domain-containing protein [Planctomycetes bacterium]|nr:DUF4838 domain-containing protein [Planctomycetota bacterium]
MGTRYGQLVAILVCLVLLASVSSAQELYPKMEEPVATLVVEGEAKCLILPADPKAQRPAEELAAYIEKISGVKPPVAADDAAAAGFRIQVGGATDMAAWATLPDDGYIIKSSRDGLLLTGKTELGIFYAVDTFLEKYLGVRWFMPGDVGEDVPKQSTIKIGKIEEAGRPVFRMRWIGRGDWARRNKMNVSVKCDGEFKIKWFVHTFTHILPPETYYAKHPEYYALIGGKRVNKRDKKDQIQICTSNPDVVKEMAANIIKIKKDDSSLNMVSLDPMDNQRFCECERCTALDEEGTETNNSMTRRLLLFYNAVSSIVGKTYPDLFMKSIAYHKYVAPPLDKSMRVNDNCVIQFCRFTCHNHALDDPTCPYNSKFNEYIKGWCRIAKNVCLYEYYYKASWVHLPWPIVHMLRKDIPYFHRMKLFGLSTQYKYNFGSNGLGYYVAAKLTWDPTLDVDALLDDFYTRFYHDAAGPMRQYHETLEQAAIDSGVHIARQRPYAEIAKLFTPELLAKLDGFVSQAEKAAADEKGKARIGMVRIALDYAKLCSEYTRALDRVRHEKETPWLTAETQNKAEAIGAPYIERLRAILTQGRKTGATGGPNGNYVKLFLSPMNVVRNWDRPDIGFGEPNKMLQKKDWLAKEGRKVEPKPMPEKFAVWFYGYDFDSDTEKSEHGVWMVKRSGERVKIGALAPVGDPGNVINKAYAIRGLSAADFLGDKATVILTNPTGEWTASTVYAVYIMPDEPGLSSADATKRVEVSLNDIRSSAMGFAEYTNNGLTNRDGEEATIEIDLVK